MVLTSKKRTLSRTAMLGLLKDLKSAPGGGTLYLPPGLPPGELEKAIRTLDETLETTEEIAKLASSSATGSVIFWGPDARYLVRPPFPIKDRLITIGYNTEPCDALLRHDYTIALVLVRLGAYAVGVCEGEKLVSSKVGTGLVHGRHKKGGSSAHRFERHRDKQIEYFFTRVCQHAREYIEPYVKQIDYIVCGGAHTTLKLLEKQCEFLERLETPALPLLLDIPAPRQAVLEASVRRVWESTVIEWREETGAD